ncbi:hypothetical protein BLNAU_16378 [Blattamonas nauphoetae]|uniref:Uncharacterized protein n=1 Tax=Blattamonas nauphoetae TaxID=2049346 RepID=A0ABQ9XBN4_9EUKA|nr:hypothetical protein BLNAU_16378 [Blattamonas nauphoetae]
MDFVHHMPVIPTIPSALTFIDKDMSIWRLLLSVIEFQWEWNKKSGDVRQMGTTVLRMLKMEGIEDAIEGKLHNHKNEDEGGWIVDISIESNNLQGMNVPEQE